MTPYFPSGKRVVYSRKGSTHDGEQGVVVGQTHSGAYVIVRLDNGRSIRTPVERLSPIALSRTPNPADSTAPSEPEAMIKIETYVNNTPLSALSDDAIIDIYARVDAEINKLSALNPTPKRIARRIEELKAQRAELTALLDKE